MAKTIGYVRVSTVRQDADNQRHEILEYANKNHLHVDDFIEVAISSRKDNTISELKYDISVCVIFLAKYSINSLYQVWI